jgi:hypothetical protein
MDNWQEIVRYCGMKRDSDYALGLALRAKKGRKLTSQEVSRIRRYADEMRWLVGSENTRLERGPRAPMTVPGVFGKTCTLTRKGDWLVEQDSSTVVGRYDPDGSLTVYPNGYVLAGVLMGVIN